MKRSVGVTLVGVLIIVLSGLMLLGAIGGIIFMLSAPMTTQTIPNAPPPEQMRMMSIMGIGFWGVMAGFGVVIGIGILRLWSWARYTAIVIGFLVAGICVLSAIVMLVIPIPNTPGTPPGFAAGFRVGMGLFYFFWAIVYAAVTIFLIRASVTEQFKQATVARTGVVEEEQKPVAVFIVAGLMLFASLGMPYVAFIQIPVLLFGVEIDGPAGKVAMLVWCLLFVIIGIGLIRRVKQAFWAAIALYGLGIVSAIAGLRDGVAEHYYAHIPQYGSYSPHFSASMFRVAMLMGVLFAIVPIVMLLVGKTKYFAWCERKQLTVAPPQV